MTPDNLAASTAELLTNQERAQTMRADLAEIRKLLTREGDPLRRTAHLISESLGRTGNQQKQVHDFVGETIR